MNTGILVGTIVFFVIGVISCIFFSRKAQEGVTNAAKRDGNKQVALITVTVGTFSTWLLWTCCYMHQLHPLVTPILEHCADCHEEGAHH